MAGVDRCGVWIAVVLGVTLAGVASAQSGPSPLPDGAAIASLEEHLESLAQRLIPVTVALRVGSAQGSGVIVTADGYVLTAAHVFDEPKRDATIIFADGRRVKGKTLGRDVAGDAGLIKLDGDGPWPHAPMGSETSLREGEPCLALGHPGGFESGRTPPLRFGVVTRTRGPFVRTRCTINEGDSGGPLFDLNGTVIGIHSRIRFNARENYHVPITVFRQGWKRLIAGEVYNLPAGEGPRFEGGPVLGIRGTDHVDGVRVRRVWPGLPADRAGLEEGDVILALDGADIDGMDGLIAAIRRRRPGDVVALSVRRRDRELTIELRLGDGDR